MRNRQDPSFAAAVDAIGNGVGEGPIGVDEREDVHDVYVPSRVNVLFGSETVDDADALRRFVHPDLETCTAREAARFAIVAVHNAVVDEHNAACLDRLPGEVITLQATHQLPAETREFEAFLNEEHLQTVTKSGTPPASIDVKPGCLLICTRNILPQLGIQNGTLLELLNVLDNVIHVRTIPEDDDAEPVEAYIPRILFELQSGGLMFMRRQFPIRLAYALTVNKVQGATKRRLGLDLRHGVFSHGQLYVALSRVPCAEALMIIGVAKPPEGERPVMRNIVYRDIIDPDRRARLSLGPAPPEEPRRPFLLDLSGDADGVSDTDVEDELGANSRGGACAAIATLSLPFCMQPV